MLRQTLRLVVFHRLKVSGGSHEQAGPTLVGAVLVPPTRNFFGFAGGKRFKLAS